ncbi:MAG: hypothetical protein ACI4T2_02250 [Christensenellales bacterium]
MKKWVLRIILIIIATILLVGTLSACGDEWAGYVEVDNLEELFAAIEDENVGKIKVNSGVYGEQSNYENLIITRPLTLKGAGEKQPVFFGSIVVNLAAGQLRGVVIDNIEISHSGEYVTKEVDGNQKVDLSKDGRRGILVNNGSVTIKNNNIHLTNQNPETKLAHPSSAIQLSVLKDAPNQDKLSYSISNNTFGKYSRSQHSSSSGAVAILADIDEGQALNFSLEQINAVYEDNNFADGTEGYEAMYDYTKNKYVAGVFSSIEAAEYFLQSDYSSLDEGLKVEKIGNVYKIVKK